MPDGKIDYTKIPDINPEHNEVDYNALPDIGGAKKNPEDSATTITPSNQPLSNAPTTTTGTLEPTMAQQPLPGYVDPSLVSPSPLATGISASAPSMSVAPEKPKAIKTHLDNVQGMNKIEALKDKTRDLFLNKKAATPSAYAPQGLETREEVNPLFADENPDAARNKETYFNTFKSMGYSDSDVNHLKEYGKQLDFNKKFLEDNLVTLSEKPNDQTALYGAGTALLGLGRYDEAITAFQKTLQTPPEQQANMIVQGDDSLGAFSQSGSLNPSNSLYGIGSALMKKGDAKGAVDYYNQAIQADPTNQQPHDALAYLMYKEGDKEGAKKQQKLANEIATKNSPFEAMRTQGEAEAISDIEQNKRAQRAGDVANMLEDFIKGDPEGKMGVLGYVTPWGLVGHSGKDMGKAIFAGIEMADEGIARMLGSLSTKEMTGSSEEREAATQKMDEEGTAERITGGAIKTARGAASAVFGAIPQVQAFNVAMMPIQEAAAANPDNKVLHIASELTSVPFELFHKIAEWTGDDVKAGSMKDDIYGMLNLIVPIAGHKVGTKMSESIGKIKDMTSEQAKGAGIKSMDDVAALVQKIADGTATPEQIQTAKTFTEYAKELTLDDVKKYAYERGKQKFLETQKERTVSFPIEGEPSSKVKELNKEVVDLNEAIKKEGTTPELKEEYQNRINEIQSEIGKGSDIQSSAIVAEKTVELTNKDSQIEIKKAELESAATPAEKAVIEEKIKELETDRTKLSSEIDSEKLYASDVQALSDVTSKEFKILAAEATPEVIDRVKLSLEKAATEGKIEESVAQENLDAFRERVEMNKVINPSIKGPEFRAEAADLIEKQKAAKERLQEMKSYIPPMPEASIARQEKVIEDINGKLSEIQTKSKEAAKEAVEVAEVIEEPVTDVPLETPPTETTGVPPIEPPKIEVPKPGEPGETNPHAVWKRVLDNIKDEKLKEGLKEEGVSYLVNKEAITESNAKTLVDAAIESDALSELEKLVIDDSVKVDPVTRGVVSSLLGKHYFDKMNAEKNPALKTKYRQEFRRFNQRAAAMATLGGQVGNAVGKSIKKLYANDPSMVIETMRQDMMEVNAPKLEQANAAEAYRSMKEILESPEVKAEIESKIREGVKNEVEELYKDLEPEKKKRIEKAISAIQKVRKTIQANRYSDATGMVAAVDTAMATIELSLKAGLSIEKAVEKGIAHIHSVIKDWKNEKLFRTDVVDAYKLEAKETLDEAIEKKQKRLEELEEFIDNPQEYINKLEEKRSKLQAKEDAKPQELKDLDEKISEAKKTLNDIVGKSPEAIQKNIETKKAELAELIKDPQEYLNGLEEKRAKAREKRDAKPDELKELEEKIAEAKKVLTGSKTNVAQKIIDSKQVKIAELDEFIKDPQKYIKELENKKAKAEANKTAKSQDLKDLESEIASKRKVLNKAVKEATKPIETRLDEIEKKAKRLKPENREKFLKDIVQEVAQEGGLTEQRFQEMYAEALGLETMTPELEQTIGGYADIVNEGIKAEKEYMKVLRELKDAEQFGASKDVISEIEKREKEAEKNMVVSQLQAREANQALSKLMKGNKKLADTLIGMMQLGALTPGSIIKNITAMPPELIFRFLSHMGQGALDYVGTGLANVGMAPEAWKERTSAPLARTAGGFKASPQAFRALFDVMIKGSVMHDYARRDVSNKITPVDAFKNLTSGKTKGDISATAANIIEALPAGYMANAMGRALAGPDALFRTYGEQAKAYELGKLEGLEGAALKEFMAEPPPEALKKIQAAGDEITFQQDNVVTDVLKWAKKGVENFADKTDGKDLGPVAKGLHGALKVIAKSQGLYVKTPTNVLGSVIKMISPELSVARAMAELTKGSDASKEAVNKHLANAAVSYAVRHVVVSAIQKGMVTPTVDWKTKEGQAQSDEDIKHGGKFNKSAYLRNMTGGDWKEQDGDVWVDYSKWTGGLGIAMGAYAEMLKDKTPEEMTQMTMVKNSYEVLPTVVKQVMDLSFMSTTAQMVDAMRDGKGVQKWVSGTVGTLATPLIPNTPVTAIKATSDTKRDTKANSIMQKIANDFNYKLTGGSDLPSKITLWGEKVTTAPNGANKFVYNMFDVVKAEDPDENSLGYKIMDLYHRSDDERVIPSVPSNQVTIRGKKVTLEGDEYERFQEYIGKIRKETATDYINSDEFKTDDDNKRAYRLGQLYSKAHKMGTDMITNSTDRLTVIKNEGDEVSVVTGTRRPRPSKRKRLKRKSRG